MLNSLQKVSKNSSKISTKAKYRSNHMRTNMQKVACMHTMQGCKARGTMCDQNMYYKEKMEGLQVHLTNLESSPTKL